MLAHFQKPAGLPAMLLLAATAAFAVDPAMLDLVMPEAKVVAGMNVDAAKASPFGQYLLGRIQNEDHDMREFIAATGFDPRTDVNEVVMASLGDRPQDGGMVVVRGVFQVSKILAAAQEHKATVTNYKGADVIVMSKNNGRPPAWVAFLNGRVALVGDAPSVTAALDRAGAAGLKPEMAARAQELSSRYHGWFISTLPVSSLGRRMPEVTGAAPSTRNEFFQSIQEVAGGVLFGSQVEITGEALTRSDRDAQALYDVVRFLGGMVQMNSDKPGTAMLAKLVESMDLQTQGPTMRVKFSVPEGDLEKLIQQPKRGTTRAPQQ